MTNMIRMSHEIKDVMDRHLEELKQYVPLPEPLAGNAPEEILTLLERLSAICENSALQAPCQLYEEACFCHLRIEDFLRVMNYNLDFNLEGTEMGRILTNANHWLNTVKSREVNTSLDEVWDFIAPVKPDRLEDLGNGVYEAKWWKPVPMMDVEILQRTNGLSVQGEPSEPKQLPGGIAVRFSLLPCVDISSGNQ